MHFQVYFSLLQVLSFDEAFFGEDSEAVNLDAFFAARELSRPTSIIQIQNSDLPNPLSFNFVAQFIQLEKADLIGPPVSKLIKDFKLKLKIATKLYLEIRL